MDQVTEKNVRVWLEEDYDRETKYLVKKLAEENPQELVDAFYQNLNFGTGGLRGVMGVGTNRMNPYTVRAAAQGLANYVAKSSDVIGRARFIIGYDPRQNSRLYAEEVAKVLAANGIEAFVYDGVHPTPLVSFGCRYKHCTGGVMVTASHNPPEYNGMKVYWSDGGQVIAPHDIGIINEANAISKLADVMVADSINHPLITILDNEIDEEYYDVAEKLQSTPDLNRRNGHTLKIVYANLHGTGIILLPEVLKRWGFTNVEYVEEQLEPDGGFPTTKSPNPEERQALELGIKKMKAVDGDILIANDPDADRMGVAVMHHDDVRMLTGNEIASLCLEHICSRRHAEGSLTENSAFVKSIVTTELFRKIALSYGKECFDTLTGFKYIAALIDQWEKSEDEKHSFLFGAEESYGFLIGTQTRDKDGIISAALICEAALNAKVQGYTLVDVLEELYHRHGVHVDRVHSIMFPESKEGHEKMAEGMKHLKNASLSEVAGVRIKTFEDYSQSIRVNLETNSKEELRLPKTEMLAFWLADGSKVMVRPSGTEPKVKIYCSVVKEVGNATVDDTMTICELHCQNLIRAVESLIK